MNYAQIKQMQRDYNVDGTQAMINSGDCWNLEGSVGRHAANLLEIGVCMLPKKARNDYYGNRIPSREELIPGSKGTYLNCKRFWSNEDSVNEFFNQEA